MQLPRTFRLFMTLAAMAVGNSVASAAPAKDAKPNIVVILCDDMGYSDLHCYGGELNTPNLDKLAEGGLRYTQFYNTGRCCPTRASLLTGLYPHQAGVGYMTGDLGIPPYQGQLNDTSVTMAQALKPAGYGTYAVGKWHVVNDKNMKPDGDKFAWPRQKGFDRFYGTITGAGDFFDPGTLTKDNTMISPFADPDYKPKQYYYTDAITDHAVSFIEDHSKQTPDKPLFMYVAYTAAHWPMQAPEDEIAKYKGKYDGGYTPIREARIKRMKELGLLDPQWEISPQFGDWDKVEHKEWEARCMEVYAAMIDRMDQGVGKIVAELEKTGRLENTLILFMQDNGGCQEPLGRNADPNAGKTFPKIAQDAVRLDTFPKQLRDGSPVLQGVKHMPGPQQTYIAYGEAWANVSNTPFRLYKHYNHEGGISTPLIAHWPAGISRKGEWEKTPGHLIDVMATCVDLGGATYPTELNGKKITPMQGVSLKPTFAGVKLDRETIYWEHEGNKALRTGDWKIVAKGIDEPWELYNIANDRTEMHDLAGEQTDRVKAMAEQWEQWAVEATVKPYPPKKHDQSDKKPKNTKVSFDLKQGDDLTGNAVPNVANQAFSVQIEVTQPGKQGVLLAQGGANHGYAVFAKGGKVSFATKINGKYTEVSAPQPASPYTLKADLAQSGAIVLTIDGKPAGKGKAGGPLAKAPVDGLQVGQDLAGVVGPYESPFAYEGKIGKVELRLTD